MSQNGHLMFRSAKAMVQRAHENADASLGPLPKLKPKQAGTGGDVLYIGGSMLLNSHPMGAPGALGHSNDKCGCTGHDCEV